MEKKLFLNKQVSEIVGITQRQVLSWTEKGLIIPFVESTGAGTKRGYDYINLLEFGLCKNLFYIGMGFRAVKKTIGDLRSGGLGGEGVIQSWANDFSSYYELMFKEQKANFIKALKETGGEEKESTLNQLAESFVSNQFLPRKPVGVLAYFFYDSKSSARVIPWDIDYVLSLSMIKDGFLDNDAGLLIDIGKIKDMIDRKLRKA